MAHAAELTVTNASGLRSTAGSLPWALFQAYWHSPGADRIRFSIPGSGPHIIKNDPSFPLFVGDQDGKSGVDIDGTTQPGYTDAPLILIDAMGLSTAFNVQNKGSTLKGLGIFNFSVVGIALLDQGSATGRHIVDSCWIGFRQYGGGYARNTDLGYTNSIGIGMSVPDNVITNNTISGVYNGITVGVDPVVYPSTSTDYWISYNNYIAGNRIGTTPDGGSIVGNTSDGVFLGNGATNNHIAYNVIGGHDSAGVELLGPSGVWNYVYGNLIGVASDGSDIRNDELGVLAANGSNSNFIGNWVANYVYYNTLGGIAVGLLVPADGTRGDAHYNSISYNALYGNGDGVAITGYSQLNVVQGNSIDGHAQHGVIVSNAHNNTVLGNAIGYFVPNGGFGVYTQYSSGNWVTQNVYGTNSLGATGTLQSADYFLD